jgi:hypothetical protein
MGTDHLRRRVDLQRHRGRWPSKLGAAQRHAPTRGRQCWLQ